MGLPQIFRDNLAKFNVTMDRVRILKGWFNEVSSAGAPCSWGVML